MSEADKTQSIESIVLGGGCFWCLEAVYTRVKGVKSVVSGYAGGQFSDPTYKEVSSGKTGHAEVVEIVFDPTLILLEDILHIFFSVHDPTTLNRQGNDIGTQYRSIILFSDKKQHDVIEKVLREVAEEECCSGELIVTELKKLEKFYPAEEYHQRYFEKNPDNAYCQLAVAPKVAKFREKYSRFFLKA
ncbi:MAG: hypothetical protein ACD_56C00141G0025 [uncultured bacterium]|nr:MAG: hypothetical protein ACD_56C00141G0025 [uncultured bacterium]